MGLVKFSKGSNLAYENLSNKNEDTLYAVNGNGDFSSGNMDPNYDLYIGEKQLIRDICYEFSFGDRNITANRPYIADYRVEENGNYFLFYSLCLSYAGQEARMANISVKVQNQRQQTYLLPNINNKNIVNGYFVTAVSQNILTLTLSSAVNLVINSDFDNFSHFFMMKLFNYNSIID